MFQELYAINEYVKIDNHFVNLTKVIFLTNTFSGLEKFCNDGAKNTSAYARKCFFF
jgi:hypothetical protein